MTGGRTESVLKTESWFTFIVQMGDSKIVLGPGLNFTCQMFYIL